MIEFVKFLIQNYVMKNVLLLIFLMLVCECVGYCKEDKNLKPDNFVELGRYKESFEINDENQESEIIEDDQDEFEQQAMIDLSDRYESNAVELQLNDVNNEAIADINNPRLFKLEVNESHYNIENKIKSENMIWDNSKNFVESYYNSRNLAPIPSVVNSQKLGVEISPCLTAKIGQTSLNDANGTSVLFVRANESAYNVGSVVSYKGKGLNLSFGSFAASNNKAASGGAILSSSPLNLPNNFGSLTLGSAFFSKGEQGLNKNTGGFFSEYKYKRLKLNAQLGQSCYSHSQNYDTSLYFIPEYKLSDSLYIKTRFIRNVSKDNMQDELALTYKPKKSNGNFEVEINASRQYTQNDTIKQRVKLSTTIRI